MQQPQGSAQHVQPLEGMSSGGPTAPKGALDPQIGHGDQDAGGMMKRKLESPEVPGSQAQKRPHSGPMGAFALPGMSTQGAQSYPAFFQIASSVPMGGQAASLLYPVVHTQPTSQPQGPSSTPHPSSGVGQPRGPPVQQARGPTPKGMGPNPLGPPVTWNSTPPITEGPNKATTGPSPVLQYLADVQGKQPQILRGQPPNEAITGQLPGQPSQQVTRSNLAVRPGLPPAALLRGTGPALPSGGVHPAFQQARSSQGPTSSDPTAARDRIAQAGLSDRSTFLLPYDSHRSVSAPMSLTPSQTQARQQDGANMLGNMVRPQIASSTGDVEGGGQLGEAGKSLMAMPAIGVLKNSQVAGSGQLMVNSPGSQGQGQQTAMGGQMSASGPLHLQAHNASALAPMTRPTDGLIPPVSAPRSYLPSSVAPPAVLPSFSGPQLQPQYAGSSQHVITPSLLPQPSGSHAVPLVPRQSMKEVSNTEDVDVGRGDKLGLASNVHPTQSGHITHVQDAAPASIPLDPSIDPPHMSSDPAVSIADDFPWGLDPSHEDPGGPWSTGHQDDAGGSDIIAALGLSLSPLRTEPEGTTAPENSSGTLQPFNANGSGVGEAVNFMEDFSQMTPTSTPGEKGTGVPSQALAGVPGPVNEGVQGGEWGTPEEANGLGEATQEIEEEEEEEMEEGGDEGHEDEGLPAPMEEAVRTQGAMGEVDGERAPGSDSQLVSGIEGDGDVPMVATSQPEAGSQGVEDGTPSLGATDQGPPLQGVPGEVELTPGSQVEAAAGPSTAVGETSVKLTTPARVRPDLLSMTPAERKAYLEDEKLMLPRRGLSQMMRAQGLDADFSLEPQVEDVLRQMVEELLTNAVDFGCKMARQRKSTLLKARDIAMYLERSYNLRIPGFSDQVRPYRRPMPSEVHRVRSTAVKRTMHDATTNPGPAGAGS